MLHSISAQRTDVPDEPEIHFMETPSNTPAAVKIWWYPGQTTGYEFIYAEEQAALLAQGGREPVLMAGAREDTAGDIPTSTVLPDVSPGAEEIPLTVEPVPAPVQPLEDATLPSSRALSDLQAVGTSGQVQERTQLPQTASAMSLIAIVGVLSIVGGAVLRGWRH
jgi:hypothetical protein